MPQQWITAFDAALAQFDFDQAVAVHASRPRLVFVVGREFRPDRAPVVGAKVLAADSAERCLLNCDAILRTGPAVGVAVLPLADLRVTLDADALAELCDVSAPSAGKVVVQVMTSDLIAFAT
jgi:hypothetical protein